MRNGDRALPSAGQTGLAQAPHRRLLASIGRCLPTTTPTASHAAWKDDTAVARARDFRQTEQHILSCSARANDQNQAAWPEGGRPIHRHRWRIHHATRCPSRQTLRTTGMPPETCTRIRSARLPTMISPRSSRPTASAGVLVTVQRRRPDRSPDALRQLQRGHQQARGNVVRRQDVEQTFIRQVHRRDVPRMRASPHHVRTPIRMPMPA